MIRRPLARALLLGLALTLAAPAAWANPLRGGEEPGPATGLFTRLLHALTTSWPDVGCWIDPNGGCGTAQAPAPPPDTEVGCWLDPYGGCGSGG